MQHTTPVFFSGTSTPILVTPSPATGALFTLPPALTAGVPFTFSVSPVDFYGNITPIATPTINFGGTKPGLTLPASYTFTAADAGVHTFMNSFAIAGSQSTTAQDTTNALVAGRETGTAVVRRGVKQNRSRLRSRALARKGIRESAGS